MLIGSHVSFGSEQLLGSAKEAVSYGASTFMFYTGAPQNTVRKEIHPDLLKKAHAYIQENGIDLNHVICHAPYIVNLANRKEEEKWQFSVTFLKNELKRCEDMGVKYMVLHPGSAVGQEKSVALKNILDGLHLLLQENIDCKILLETMALKGSEVGSLDDIQYLLDGTDYQVGVCLDTCHLNDAGVDLSDVDLFLSKIDEKIGLDHVYCIHLNDSKNTVGSKKDRHANIGYGTIGFDVLCEIAHHEKLKEIPKILETPYIGDSPEDTEKKYAPYQHEIQMLKNRVFDHDLYQNHS